MTIIALRADLPTQQLWGRTSEDFTGCQAELFGSSPPAGEGEAALRTQLEQFTQGMLEVLSSRRPVRQLDRLLSDQVRINVCKMIRSDIDLHLVSVRGQRTSATTVEASAHVRLGSRSIAIAFKMAKVTQRWVCCAWQLRGQDLVPAPVQRLAA